MLPFVSALLIGLEFALDRWQDTPRWSMYLVMAAALAVWAWAGIRLLQKEKSRVNVRGRVG